MPVGTAIGTGVTDRVGAATIAKWIKEVSDLAERKMALLPILRKKGRVKDWNGGAELRWIFDYKNHALLGHIDAQARPYTRLQHLLNAALDFAYYEMEDSITPRELMENGGEPAIVKIFDKKMAKLQNSFAQAIASQFYNDNSVAQTGIPSPMAGFESMMSFGSQTATELYQSSSDDTYAGQSTAVTGQKADAVSTDEEYGVWTPVGVNCNQTVSGSAVAFADNGDEYIDAGLVKAQRTQAEEDRVDVVLLTQEYFRQFKNLLRDKERVMLSPDYAVNAYGFPPGQAIQFGGALVNWDAAIASTDADSFAIVGYGINTSKVELLAHAGIPGWTKGKDSLAQYREFIDPQTGAVQLRLLFGGQMRVESPKYHIKFSKFAA